MPAESFAHTHPPRPTTLGLPIMEVVRSACPGCQHPLTVPADWVGKTVRCKHCGHAMQVRKKAAAPPPLPRANAAVPVARPAPTWEALPDNRALPEFTPPLAQPTAEIPAGPIVTAVGTVQKYAGRGRYKGPRNHGWVKYAVLGLLLAALAAGVGAGIYLKPGLLKSLTGGAAPSEEDRSAPVAGGGPYVPPAVTPAASGAFPRRMLAISIHSYLYLNPLRNGEDVRGAKPAQRTGTDAAVGRLAERWRVPRDQFYHLTDVAVLDEKDADAKAEPKPEPKRIEVKPIPKKGAPREPAKKEAAKKGPPKKDAMDGMPDQADDMPVIQARRFVGTPPLKSVVEGTIARFLESSRAQDRIVLVFCGHVAEKKGEIYLVPLDGDLDEVETLIPLKWFYDKLAACPAQEKVVIYDVCRLDPEAGIERPHPGPMTEAMEKALHTSPEGVSVVTSCSKGEYAVETDSQFAPLNYERPDIKDSGINLRGSFFLSLVDVASIKGFLAPENKLSAPEDELPVERMASWIGGKLGDVVKRKFADRTQTVKATIKRKPDAVPYDPNEPMPGRFEFPAPPPSADPKAVVAVLREIQLPPVKALRPDAAPPPISDVLPFKQEALKDYLKGELKPNARPNEFQKAVLDAMHEMRALREAGSGKDLPETFSGDTSDGAKAQLRKVQEVPALVESILQEQLENLEKVADQRDKQPKRWQAHYDYVLAQVKLRICYANQYNLALANFRSGKLPDLKDGQTGYRLSAEMTLDKNTPATYKEMFTEARRALADIAKEYPGTPWALLAKSDKAVAIGLRLIGSSGKGS
jgi:Caspase domain